MALTKCADLTQDCLSYPKARCIVYTGPSLPCIGSTVGERLDSILAKIDAKLCNPIDNINFEDTSTIDFTVLGDTVSAIVKISAVENNSILRFSDGIYDFNTIESGVVYGGEVFWLQDYDYRIEATGYYINGVFYESPETFVTLSPADGTYNRIDSFIVDINSLASVLEGTPSINPQDPPIDLATQLQLSFAIVETGTTQPSFIECVYQENTEWTAVSSTVRIDPDSSDAPCTNIKSVKGLATLTGDFIEFTAGSPITPFVFQYLALSLRAVSWATNSSLVFQCYLSGSPTGNSVVIANGSYGFDSSNIVDCQPISIPTSNFGLSGSDQIDGLRITTVNSGVFSWFLDDMCFQFSLAVAPPPAQLLFNDGLNKYPSINTVKLGQISFGTTNANTGPTDGWFSTSRVINTAGGNLLITGFPVGSPITETYHQQQWAFGSSIASWLSNGSLTSTEPDYINQLKLRTGYTGRTYEYSAYPLPGTQFTPEGYMGDKIGYWLSTNLNPYLFQLGADSTTAKIAGMFMHTYDTTYTDAITFFASNPQPSTPFGNIGNPGTCLTPMRVMTLKTDKDVQLWGYPDTRDDGDTLNALYVDVNGNVKHGPIGITGSGPVITADNGLIKNTPTNVQLGSVTPGAGDLLHDTWIDLATFSLNISNGINPFLYLDHANTIYALGDYNGADNDPVLILGGASNTVVLASSGTVDKAALSLDNVNGTSILGDVTNGFNITRFTVDDNNQLSTLTREFRLSDYGVGTYTGTDTYWLAVDATGNVIEMPSPTINISADNGLTENVANNIQLGGTLLQTTTINTTAAYNLIVSGTNVTSATLEGVNQTGVAIYGRTTGAGTGVVGFSSAGTGISGFGGTLGAYIGRTSATLNDINQIAMIDSQVQGVALNNTGGYLSFRNQTSTTSQIEASRIASRWTTVAHASRTSDMEFWGVNNTTLAKKASLKGSGQWVWDTYGIGTHTGTETYILATTATGEIIEFPSGGLPGGGALITANGGLTTTSATNVRLGAATNGGAPLLGVTYVNLNGFSIGFTGGGSSSLAGTVASGIFGGTNQIVTGHSSVAIGGANSVVSGNGAISIGTDCTVSGNYGLAGNDANDVFAESSSGFGFGNDQYDTNGFIIGNSNVAGALSSGTGVANTYGNSFVGGSASRSVGNRTFVFGQQARATANDAYIFGTGAPILNSTAASFGVGFNASVPDFLITEDKIAINSARFEEYKGANVVAANNLTVGTDGNLFIITGATQINAITTANWQAGSVIRLQFASTPTVKHNTAGGAGTAVILLSGSVDFVAAADDVLTLVYDGTSWHESSRKLAGASFTADNGLTKNSTTNVQLGATAAGANSPFLHNTYLNADVYVLNLLGSVQAGGNEALFYASNSNNLGSVIKAIGASSNDPAIYGSGSGTGIQGIGLYGVVGTGAVGIFGNGTSSGIGVKGAVTNINSVGVVAENITSGTNDVINIMEADRGSSGTPANGIGGIFSFKISTTTTVIPNSSTLSNQLISKWTDATHATRTSQFIITGVNSSVTQDILTINAGGALKYTTFVDSDATNVLTPTSAYLQCFSGSSATTWTLPAISGNTGLTFIVKNRGSATITLNSDAGSTIYNTAAVGTMSILAGESFTFINDGTYYVVC